ncbi:hypothetical protein PTKU64_07560 [Paraburkholderia terrae]|uniref:Uncharacterized protein n=1 Tax=Paraburkholderia terrae TaxID=311230 RepID=A0ABN6J8T4_9BURK|nr:hypothetical protein PTKU64_07560 [Paraburkholderia terrae]
MIGRAVHMNHVEALALKQRAQFADRADKAPEFLELGGKLHRQRADIGNAACMLQQPAGFWRTDEDFVALGQSPRNRNDVCVVTASATFMEVGQ